MDSHDLLNFATEGFRREFMHDKADLEQALRAIVAARDLAPDALIPSPLMCAIEDARRLL